MPHAFILFNERAGNADQAALRQALAVHLEIDGWTYEVFVRTKGVKRRRACANAVDAGADLLVAAGGDGTVAKVADVGAQRGVPVGILPVGTGNLIARELGIPLDLHEAIQVLVEGKEVPLDAMDVGGRRCFSKVAVGLYADVVDDLSAEDKARLGRLAYLQTMLAEVADAAPVELRMTVDGTEHTVCASTILVANVGATGIGTLRWADAIDPTDGVVDVCVVVVDGLLQAGKLALDAAVGASDSTQVEVYPARQEVVLHAATPDSLIRGDGSSIGTGSVSIRVEPGAVRVKVPSGARRLER